VGIPCHQLLWVPDTRPTLSEAVATALVDTREFLNTLFAGEGDQAVIQQLLQEDARLRAALDAMPHKVWIVEVDGPPIYYNPAMRDFAGPVLRLPDRPSRERALIHPDDLAQFVCLRTAAVAAEKDWAIEVRMRCPDGGFRWHRLNFALVRSGGRAAVYLATATDIHDLRQTLATAQDSEEQLRLAAEAAHLGIYTFDLQSGNHAWSAELKKIFGLDVDQAPPRSIIDLIHPEDRGKFQNIRRASFDPTGSGTFEDEHRILRPGGSERWVFVKGRVSFAGEGASRQARRGVGLVLDITDRKLAEQALALSEARYRMIFEQANDVVVTLQLDGRILSINPAARDILGYAPEELVGKTIYEFVPREHTLMQWDMLNRKLKGEVSTQYDLDVVTRDRRRRVLSVNSRLVFDRLGQPAMIHSIARDVTERRDAERRQHVLVRELQHRTKNILAVIQSIATNTFKSGSELETFVDRLHALAHAQEFVAAGPQGGAPLRYLVEAGLEAFGSRAKVEGEDLLVSGRFAQSFALLLHELATNAGKYGAFSSPAGWVAIQWRTDDAHLHFSWREQEGRRIESSRRRGFGTLLMSSFAGSRIQFSEHGLEFEFSVPLGEVLSPEDESSTSPSVA
jgi:PAS domain S-box-containing protein